MAQPTTYATAEVDELNYDRSEYARIRAELATLKADCNRLAERVDAETADRLVAVAELLALGEVSLGVGQ